MGVNITFANQKGGVSKTSCCIHLGGALAQAGYRVLLLDCDPQASLTLLFYEPKTFYAIPPAESVAALYDPIITPAPEQIIRATHIPGLDLVSGSSELARVNTTPVENWGPIRRGIRDFLEHVDYDLILIDTPPNLYLCTHTALIAADWVVIPTQSELFGLQGLSPVTAAITAVQADTHPDLKLAGYLITMHDKRLGIHQSHDTILRESLGDAVFATRLPRSKDFIEAVAARQPVTHHRPKGAASEAVRMAAAELLDRVGVTSRMVMSEGTS